MGFSAAAFITILDGADAPENYQLYGRYRVTRDWAVRTALRYEHLFNGEQELQLATRLGADYVVRETSRFQLYSGGDLVTGYDRFLNGDRTYRVGGAPVLGVLLYLTPHISLSVEPRLVATYTYFDNRAGGAANEESLSIEVKGDGLLILSVHF